MYWATGILGILLALAPFGFRYTGNVQATWTSVVLGLAIFILSVIAWNQRRLDQAWEYWGEEALGILAIIAPFVVGFSNEQTALWSTVVTGILVVIIAGWRLFAKPIHQIRS